MCASSTDLLLQKRRTLKGSHVYMDVVSVGATINVMMAAAMADGMTIIEKCGERAPCC